MRAVLWAAILVVGFRGVTAILFDGTSSSSTSGNGAVAGTANDAGNASAPAAQFPAALAEAFALRFGQVYLNFSPGSATRRAQQLAAFIPAGAHARDPQFGWSGTGTSVLESLQVAGITVHDAKTAVVTLLGTVNNRLMQLGVPLYAAGNGLVVSGEPAWLPAPPVAMLPSPRRTSSDAAAAQALSHQLPAFFLAYASGDQGALGRYLAPGAAVGGLGGAVSFGSITSIDVPAGGRSRDITVTVDWTLPGAAGLGAPRLATSYDMSVIDQQSGRWYVKDIRASTQPMGTQ